MTTSVPSFAEFQASRTELADLRAVEGYDDQSPRPIPGYVYLDVYCIETRTAEWPPESEGQGRYHLAVSNETVISDDLEDLERRLYDACVGVAVTHLLEEAAQPRTGEEIKAIVAGHAEAMDQAIQAGRAAVAAYCQERLDEIAGMMPGHEFCLIDGELGDFRITVMPALIDKRGRPHRRVRDWAVSGPILGGIETIKVIQLMLEMELACMLAQRHMTASCPLQDVLTAKRTTTSPATQD